MVKRPRSRLALGRGNGLPIRLAWLLVCVAAAPGTVRAVAGTVVLFGIGGFGLVRLLLPAPLRRHELLWVLPAGGCATIRVTDPPRTADEEFLLSEAARKCVGQLNVDPLRDR